MESDRSGQILTSDLQTRNKIMRHQRFAGSLLIGVSVGLLACGGNAETQAAPEEMQVADLTMDECWLRPETSQEDARARVSPRSVTPVTF